MKLRSKASFVLILFLILLNPVEAYQDVDITKTNEVMILNCRDLNCLRESLITNCYIACRGTAGTGSIFKFNGTLENKRSCDIHTSCPSPEMIIPKNSSHVWLHCDGTNQLRLYNVSDIVNGNCDNPVTLNGVVPSTLTGGDWYKSESHLYLSDQANKIINEAGTTIFTGYWLGGRYDLSIPDKADNTTLWIGRDTILKYVNGVLEANSSVAVSDIYGKGTTRGMDLIKLNDSLTWLYFYTAGSTSTQYNLYRANFTHYEVSGYGVVRAKYPDFNETIPNQIFNYEVWLDANVNGTLMYFKHDGSTFINWANDTITNCPCMDQLVSEQHTALTSGTHYWYAVFVTELNDTFSTGVITFQVIDSGLIPTLVRGLGSLFGIQNYDDQRLIIWILLSLGLTVFVTLKMKSDQGMIFVAVMFVMTLVGLSLGFVNAMIGLPMLLGLVAVFAILAKGALS